jgi:hypothetical protein
VKFFNYMHNFTAVNGSDHLIKKASLALRGIEYLENTPQLLVPNDNKSCLQYSNYSQYIDIHQALIAELSQNPLVLTKSSIFIDTPCIPAPLLISHEMPKYITSTIPGATQHYITTFNASKIPVYDVIKSFWPLSAAIFDKIFLIDTLICSIDPKDPLAIMIGLTESTMTFKHVMIRIIKSDQLRIIFTTQKGTFSANMRKLSSKSTPVLRNPQKLSIEASEKYNAYYNDIQSQCMQITETNSYKELKTQYAQALELAKK